MPNKVSKLRFGISSLDEFFGGIGGLGGIEIPDADGTSEPADDVPTTSICVVGPDGTGKSVIAMHVASHYAMDAAYAGCRPRILYISTDLRREKAQSIWSGFGLQRPWLRDVPGTGAPPLQATEASEAAELAGNPTTPSAEKIIYEVPAPPKLDGNEVTNISLRAIDPRDSSRKGRVTSFVSYLTAKPSANGSSVQVGFLDLAARTAGDDWAYVNRVISMLDVPKRGEPASLVVIDAIEGLEAMSSEIDSFGERRDRRSRIAQLLRNVGGKCHLVLIVEEAQSGARNPEQFVADAVVRLSVVHIRHGNQTHSRRYLEIEKVRGQTVVRGQHPFMIADGKGSYSRVEHSDRGTTVALIANAKGAFSRIDRSAERTTPELDPSAAWRNRELANYDDPPAFLHQPGMNPPVKYCSYVHVFHSIGYSNRKAARTATISGDADSVVRVSGFCDFGIAHLDNMLDSDDANIAKAGLRFGTVTALVGENGTNKSRLAKSFLASAFYDEKNPQIAIAIGLDESDFQDLSGEITRWITFRNSGQKPASLDDRLKTRLMYRRLSIQDRSSPVLYNVVERTLEEAKKRLLEAKRRQDPTYRLRASDYGNIRLVLTNVTTMRSVFPDIDEDPLFLPAVVELLRRQGVTSLIIATEPGSPNSGRQSDFARELRGLVQHHICTWHVPFFGEDKVAISVIPPILSDRPAIIRELRYTRRQKDGIGELVVDPNFEMYTGLFEGQNPHLVPVRVKLIGYGCGFNCYVDSLNRLFSELYGSASSPVQGADFAHYEDLRSLSYLHSSNRMDHTLVLQVDEFWSSGTDANPRSGLCDLKDYLECNVSDRMNDPLGVFSATAALPRISTRRAEFENSKASEGPYRRDRVPFTWDFGFLMLRERAWKSAKSKSLRINYLGSDKSVTVADILSLIDPNGLFYTPGVNMGDDNPMTRIMACRQEHLRHIPHLLWREFLHACVVTAQSDASQDHGHALPFDVDTFAPETLSSLVLEVWFSEILISSRRDQCAKCKANGPLATSCDSCAAGARFKRLLECDSAFPSLDELVDQYAPELFRTFLLLGEVLSASQLGIQFVAFEEREKTNSAVASRHWYSTACPLMETHRAEDPLIPVALPGGFAVRGDWYLAITYGSRSARIGHRVLDVLSTRRSNINRLQKGIGLPTRDFVDPQFHTDVWTPLFNYSEFGSRLYHSYRAIRRLGTEGREASHRRTELGAVPDYGFEVRDRRWLRRSSISCYDQHARLFSKLIGRLLYKWPSFTEKLGKEGLSGFDHYDHVSTKTGLELESDDEDNKYRIPFRRFKTEALEGWQSGFKYSIPICGGPAADSVDAGLDSLDPLLLVKPSLPESDVTLRETRR